MDHQRTLERVLDTLLLAPLAIPLAYAVGLLAHHHAGLSFLYVLTFAPFAKTMVFEALVELALLAYVIRTRRDPRVAPFLTPAHAGFLLLGAVLLVTALVSEDPSASMVGDPERADGLLFLAHLGVYGFLCSWVIRDAAHFRRVLHFAVVTGVAALALVSIDAIAQHQSLISSTTWRLVGGEMLGNPNFFSHYILLLAVANGYALLGADRRPPWSWIIAVLLLGYLALTASSTALLLGIALLLVILWVRNRWWCYGIILAGLVIALAFTVVRGPPLGALQSLRDSATIRRQIWSNGIATVLRTRPVIGFGWANNDLLWNRMPVDVFAASYGPYDQYRYDKMHNAVVEWLAVSGLIGAGLGVAVWGRLLAIAIRRRRQTELMRATAIALAIAVAYLLFNFSTLMSAVLTSVLLSGFVLAADERRRMLPLPAGTPGAAAIVVLAAGVAWSLVALHARPAYAYALRTQAEIIRSSAAPLPPAARARAFALLDRARAIPHPYDLIDRDLGDVAMRIVATAALTDAERTQAYDRLLTTYDRLIARHPTNPNLHHRRAWVEGTFGHRDREARDLEGAVALAPANGTFRFQLTQVYLRQRRFPEARAVVESLAADGLFGRAPTFLLGAIDLFEGDIRGGRRRITPAVVSYAPTTIEWRMLTAAQRERGVAPEDILAWYRRLAVFARGSGPAQEITALTTG